MSGWESDGGAHHVLRMLPAVSGRREGGIGVGVGVGVGGWR